MNTRLEARGVDLRKMRVRSDDGTDEICFVSGSIQFFEEGPPIPAGTLCYMSFDYFEELWTIMECEGVVECEDGELAFFRYE